MGKFKQKQDKTEKSDASTNQRGSLETPEKAGKASSSKRTRDFSLDLEQYLKVWREDKPSWKFNKVLQAWGIQECLNGDCVKKNLFHDLLPYLATVQGGARERLLERCEQVTVGQDEQTEVSLEVKRARKIIAKVQKAAKKDD